MVVDHHDSYTWNLVHLVAEVTGALPTVVQHDEVTAAQLLRHEHRERRDQGVDFRDREKARADLRSPLRRHRGPSLESALLSVKRRPDEKC